MRQLAGGSGGRIGGLQLLETQEVEQKEPQWGYRPQYELTWMLETVWLALDAALLMPSDSTGIL